MGRILVADDHDALRRGLALALSGAGHDVEEAGNGNAAIERLHEGYFDVVLSDLKMGGSDGLDVLRTTKSLHPSASVILMTAFGSVSTAVEAMKHGAFDYDFERIVGASDALKKVLGIVKKVAKSNSTVLIRGETGTGKELIAGAIHHNSLRAARNFVKVNCAALQENLLESELFGHDKGAFTSADRQRIGRFEQADGGSLFLDEIGDMSPSTQAKILRVLQEHEFERLGGTRTIKVDVRLIAATNRDLPTMVAKAQFREDLYYRLNVVTVEIPPLRERKEDILPLAMWFIRRFGTELKKKLDGADTEAQKMLMRYNWPGNIRELENAIERAALLAEGSMIRADDLRLGDFSASSAAKESATVVKIPPTGIALEEIERQSLLEALKMSNWVQKDAAELLAISPRVMNYKIKTLNIQLPRRRLAVSS
jgi:two-component system, NtrC family, response regulator AtoC